eukprot:gene18685-24438_t
MNSSSYQSSSLVVIGDGSVGKSSIISAFRINGFQQIKGDIYISLSVWDIGGQSIQSKNLDKYIGGLFVSAKTGDNVVKSFYQIASDSVGIKLSSAELEVHDKVLTAYITKGDDSKEGRTAFADEIEAEDLAAEMNKNSPSTSCCIVS